MDYDHWKLEVTPLDATSIHCHLLTSASSAPASHPEATSLVFCFL